MKPLLAALSLLLVAAAAAAGSDSGELDAVMRLLAAHRHGRVDFVEQHFMPVLRHPVESYGVMTYQAPDRLEKRTVEPVPETLVADGNVLSIERKGRTRVIELSAHPSILPFIESLRATLAGDLGALEQVFKVDFSGTVARWTLDLAPRDARVARIATHVRIEGAGDDLLRVEILAADGSRSLTTLRKSP